MTIERTMSYQSSRVLSPAEVEQVSGADAWNWPSVIGTYKNGGGFDVRLD